MEKLIAPNCADISGFGKLWMKVSGDETKAKVPPLHFLITKKDDGYDSFCLELSINGYSKDLKKSVSEMIREIAVFIHTSSVEDILERFSEDFSPNHWAAYRKLNAEASFAGSEHTNMDRLMDLLKVLELVESILKEYNIEIEKQSEIITIDQDSCGKAA